MISLRELHRLAETYADDLDHQVAPFLVGDREIDTDRHPAVMGVVNLSQDSSYRESIASSPASAVRKGLVMTAQGADFVDLGAESTVRGAGRVSAGDQVASLSPVIEELSAAGVAVSVEGYDPEVVRGGLAAGARVVNLTGTAVDDDICVLAARYDASLILCHVIGDHARDIDERAVAADPVPEMLEQFDRRVARAHELGVRSVAIDPGIGLVLGSLRDPAARLRHQTQVMLGSFRLRRLGVPICHALPHAIGVFEDQFRSAEGVFSLVARLGGTGIFRTHEVPLVRAVLAADAGLQES